MNIFQLTTILLVIVISFVAYKFGGKVKSKCQFCTNDKYVDRLNSNGVLESFCHKCYIERIVSK